MKLKLGESLFFEKIFKSYIGIYAIILLASVLFFYQIDTESLWLDETFSIVSAQTRNSLNFNRPLYFFLLKIWLYFGESDAWLRSLSVLFGLISVWLTYRIGHDLVNRSVGLIAALLVTLSPFVINHAQEVRMYVLSMCLSLAGSLALTRLIRTWRMPDILWWLVFRCLAVLTTPINILLFAPDALILGWHFRQYNSTALRWVLKKWWLLLLITLALAVVLKDIVPPLVAFLLELKTNNSVGIPAFIGAITKFTIWKLESPLEAVDRFYEPIFLNIYTLGLLLLLAIAGLRKHRNTEIYWLFAWGFVPLIILFALAQVIPTIWGVTRYLLFTAPYIFLLLATGIETLWRRQRILAVLMVLIYAIAVSGSLYNYYGKVQREDWRGVVSTINLEENIGDRIVLFPKNHLPAFEHYYQGNNNIATLDRLSKAQMRQIVDRQAAEKLLEGMPSFETRLWFVMASAHQSIRDSQQIVPQVLAENFHIKQAQQFHEIELFLLENQELTSAKDSKK